MPGQLLKFDLNLQQLCSSKQLAFKAFDEPLPELNLECFLQNLAQTISPTLKTGIFLSGGIDSASIACGLKVLGVADLTAFTIKIKPGPGLVDESELASNLAKKLGISHELLDLTNFNLIQSFEAFVAALDAPSTDGLNTFLLSQFAAGQVKVALSGLGGDELFFGYPQMRQFAWAQAHPRLFSFIKPLLPRLSGWQSLAPLLRRFNLDFLVNYRFDHQLEATLAARELLLAADPIAAYFGSDSLIVPQREASLTIQQAEFMAYTGPVLLSDSDCLSMASSLELRVPLLNPKFVQRALALSPEQLIGSTGWPNKPWFCKLLQALVPAYILRQPKAGFVLPVGSWLLASRKTFEAQLQQFKILPTEFAKNLWHDLAARPWRWRQLWGVLVLQTWLRQLKIDLPDKF